MRDGLLVRAPHPLDRLARVRVCSTALTLRIVSMESGETLRRVRQPIRRGKAIEVIEQFGSRLLLKQHGGPLLIIDMLTSSVTKMRQEYFRRPCSLIYLYECAPLA